MNNETKIHPTKDNVSGNKPNLIGKTLVVIANIAWPSCIGGQMLVNIAFGPSDPGFFSYIRSYHSDGISIIAATFLNILTLIYGLFLYSQDNEKAGTFFITASAIPMAIISILLLVF